MGFIKNLKMGVSGCNNTVFKLLTDSKDQLWAHDILKHYNFFNKHSPFHEELLLLQQKAMEIFTDKIVANKHSLEAKNVRV